MRRCHPLAPCLALLLLAAACSDAPEETGEAAVVLYDYVPDDSAYAVVSGQPFPEALREKIAGLVDAMDAAVDGSPGLSDDEKRSLRLIYSLSMASFGGSPTLGFAAGDEWVLYGANLKPRFRAEVSEPEKLRAAIEALVASSEGQIESGERDGRTYWRWKLDAVGGGGLLATLNANLLSAGFATQEEEESAVIDDLLAAPVRGSGRGFKDKLADVRATHGFTEQMAGYVDVVTLAAALPAGDAGDRACAEALEKAAAGAPRMALGYTEASASRVTTRWVIELSEEAAKDLAQWPVAVPGLGRGDGVFSLGFGFDLSKTAKAASELGQSPTLAACGVGEQASDPASLAQATTMLTLAGGPRGLNVVLDAFPEIRPGEIPKLQGAAIAVLDNPEMALGMMSMLAPQVGQLKLDGEPMDLAVPGAGGGQPIAVAASGNTLVAAVGPDRAARARAALSAAPSADGTVFSLTSSVADLMAYTTQMAATAAQAASDPKIAEQVRLQVQMSEAYGKLFGSSTTTMRFRPEGIVFESAIEVR